MLPTDPRFYLRNSLEIFAASMLVAICVIIFVGVFCRYFLHIGLGWTEEAARYIQVWLTFVGATVAVKRWAHFQLTIVNQWIPDGMRRYTRIFAILVVIVLAVVLIGPVKALVSLPKVAPSRWKVGIAAPSPRYFDWRKTMCSSRCE